MYLDYILRVKIYGMSSQCADWPRRVFVFRLVHSYKVNNSGYREYLSNNNI